MLNGEDNLSSPIEFARGAFYKNIVKPFGWYPHFNAPFLQFS